MKQTISGQQECIDVYNRIIDNIIAYYKKLKKKIPNYDVEYINGLRENILLREAWIEGKRASDLLRKSEGV